MSELRHGCQWNARSKWAKSWYSPECDDCEKKSMPEGTTAGGRVRHPVSRPPIGEPQACPGTAAFQGQGPLSDTRCARKCKKNGAGNPGSFDHG